MLLIRQCACLPPELGLLGGEHGSLPMHSVHLDWAVISELITAESGANVDVSAGGG